MSGLDETFAGRAILTELFRKYGTKDARERPSRQNEILNEIRRQNNEDRLTR